MQQKSGSSVKRKKTKRSKSTDKLQQTVCEDTAGEDVSEEVQVAADKQSVTQTVKKQRWAGNNTLLFLV